MPRLRTYWPILPYLLIILLALLALPELAFTDRILARGDTFAYFYPYWDARQLAFQAGQLPLWTADIFMGAPLLANPQIGIFYPLNWLVTPFPAPDAVRYSVLMHIILAGIGTYILARRLAGERLPALVAALIFMLGGMLGGHLEQVNQLQGLAWLPWLILVYQEAMTQPRWGRWLLLFGIIWAIQIFTGHTQTTFMAGIAMALYGLVFSLQSKPRLRHLLIAIGVLVGGTILAALLALPQLLPTLELSGMSNRSSFDVYAVTAFSLPLHYLPRALLPSYDGQLFTEYLGYIGIIGMGLAIIGAIMPRSGHSMPRWPWLVLTILGLLLALGRYAPLYWTIGELPGFNLFRVPARWLALYTLGTAMLAAAGLQAMLHGLRPSPTVLSIVLMLLSGLMLLARFVIGTLIDPSEIVGPAVPTSVTMLGWLLALAALIFIIYMAVRLSAWQPRGRFIAKVLIVALAAGELIAAGRIMPYHNLAPREAYLSQTLTTRQLHILNEDDVVPPRVLPISMLAFDPGNRNILEARYAAWGLDERATFNALVAIKKQEMLFPNLPLTWDVPSVDGFGGGVLPTTYYTQFTSLMLPPDSFYRALDGRLGERMASAACRGLCMTDSRYLQMIDAGYLIADKTFDIPYEGVFYDTSLSMPWQAMTLRVEPTFQATEIHLLLPSGVTPPTGEIDLIGDDSEATLSLDSAETVAFEDFTLLRLQVSAPMDVRSIELDDLAIETSEAVETEEAEAEPTAAMHLYAVTLVDSRTGTYWQVPLDGWMRVLSSDIKIYERENTLGRAYMVPNVITVPDTWAGSEEAVAYIRQADFDPAQTAIIHTEAPPQTEAATTTSTTSDATSAGTATITHYEDTRVEISVTSEDGGYLILSDAYYPGWKATMDNTEMPIYRANVMFRAVEVPAGEHVIVFTFEPTMWIVAIGVGVAAWVVILVLLIGLTMSRRGIS
ncbi:YfhO family protein [Phototrophicus methaneseepsis]|uniref:YfhO family protein n=1 Tax=Phototrophicus methaneseepsis TaxID=2710758 RepID=A0A7S8EAY7_9CHLR|nr:YfhO family protein [Phototrophicus methaneseepsis]QPC83606.1 YfhO family protein [Phototrophicus methaneseepsis]